MAAVGLDARLAKAHGGELDHLDFLQVPLSGRDHSTRDRRLRTPPQDAARFQHLVRPVDQLRLGDASAELARSDLVSP
jgi:hypothetical protein